MIARLVRRRRARRRPRAIVRARAGFSLAELIVTLGLLSFVTGALVRTMVGVMKSYGSQTKSARSVESLRAAEMLVTRALRASRADARAIGSATITPDPLAHGTWDNVRLRSDLNSDGDVADQLEDMQISVSSDTMFVRWAAGQTPQAAAYPVRSLLFEFFKTDGTAVPTASGIATARRVRLTIAVPREPGSNILVLRQTWVYLRN